MSKATASVAKENQAKDLLWSAEATSKLSMAAIFNTMRILKSVNPGDTYYENYLGMKKKYGEEFFDTYQVMWSIGVHRAPFRILEVGCRSGISLCQLLSAHKDLSQIERIDLVDPFDQWISPALVMANLNRLNLPFTTKQGPGLAATERLNIYVSRSQEMLPALAEGGKSYDYILVDGDHTKAVALEDLENAHLLIEKEGVILFDDISTAPGECCLIDVWEEFEKTHKKEYAFAHSMKGKGVGIAIRL